MSRALQILALLIPVFIGAADLTQAQGCPGVNGYSFYPLQEVAGAFTIRVRNLAGNLSDIAADCGRTPRCNGFSTRGQLLRVPLAPTFSFLDGSDPSTLPCDGTYIAASRTLSGLIPPAGVNASKLRAESEKAYIGMQAVIAAANRVAAKLLESGLNPRNASRLPAGDLARAFDDARTPLSQSSSTSGSYSYPDVLAALSYPVWDSRQANGTAYNYISPVKD
ncbi:hypothetical protein Agub_g7435, partial [Astrephomene gubernaculifera]